MSTMFKQFVLKAKGCSGRGIRMRILGPVKRAAIRAESAKQLDEQSTQAEWLARENVMGIIATVTETTQKIGFKSTSELLGDGVEWKKLDPEDMEEHLADYFNAKDLDALAKTFRILHDVTDREVEDILGEAQDVTVD